MKLIFVIFCISCFGCKVLCGRNSGSYTNYDLDSVLSNDKILKNYLKCVLSEGPCTKEGRELQRLIPDAIKTDCAKCNDTQKAGVVKVFKVVDERFPDLMKKMMRKFDPTGEHEKRFRENVLKQGTEVVGAGAAKVSSTPSTIPVIPAGPANNARETIAPTSYFNARPAMKNKYRE